MMQKWVPMRRAKASFLFHDEKRQLLLLVELNQDIADVGNDIGLNAFGRLIENHQARRER